MAYLFVFVGKVMLLWGCFFFGLAIGPAVTLLFSELWGLLLACFSWKLLICIVSWFLFGLMAISGWVADCNEELVKR